MNFAHAFKSIRKEKKITQEEAADLLGVNRRTVICWEAGKHRPQSENAILQRLQQGNLIAERGLLVGECYTPDGNESLYYKDGWKLLKLNKLRTLTSEEALDWLEEREKFDAVREYFGDLSAN